MLFWNGTGGLGLSTSFVADLHTVMDYYVSSSAKEEERGGEGDLKEGKEKGPSRKSKRVGIG